MELIRFLSDDTHTLGRLYVGDVPDTDEIIPSYFYTIECPWVNNQPFQSCVPCGLYLIKYVESNKYGMAWEIQNVIDRTSCLFHVANWAKDVTGCIGLGIGCYPDLSGVSSSRIAMAKFMEWAGTEGTWQLTIRDGIL